MSTFQVLTVIREQNQNISLSVVTTKYQPLSAKARNYDAKAHRFEAAVSPSIQGVYREA